MSRDSDVVTVSDEDWRALLQADVGPCPPEAKTVNEIAPLWGLGNRATRELLHRKEEQGEVKSYRKRILVGNSSRVVKMYVMLPPEKDEGG